MTPAEHAATKYPPPPADVAIQIAKERIEEWDYEADPHGYCHSRPMLITLVALGGRATELERMLAYAHETAEKAHIILMAERARATELEAERDEVRETAEYHQRLAAQAMNDARQWRQTAGDEMGLTERQRERAERAETALREAKWLIGAGLPHTMEWHDRADAWFAAARAALGETP